MNSLSKHFREIALGLVGHRNVNGALLISATLGVMTRGKALEYRRLACGERLRVADVARSGSRTAVSIGGGRWVESGSFFAIARETNTVDLKRRGFTFHRSQVELEIIATPVDGIHYWVLAYAEGRTANEVLRFCKERGIQTTTKRTHRGMDRLIQDVAGNLPA